MQGAVAAVTNSPQTANGSSVDLIELGNESSAPLGADWTATQRYAHLSQATLLEAVDSLSAVSGLALATA